MAKHRRVWVVVGLLAALSPFLARSAPPKTEKKTVTLTGNVVPLAELVGKLDTKLDPDAVPHSLVLQAEDGKLYPLIKDSGSRLFFADARLLKRPMRLTGRLLPGSQLLQVLEARSIHKGKLFEVYYWCDICSIRRGEKMICECCGGPMDLKEEPVRQ